jgi:hypothetical protein
LSGARNSFERSFRLFPSTLASGLGNKHFGTSFLSGSANVLSFLRRNLRIHQSTSALTACPGPGPVARLIGFALGLLVTPFLFLIIVATLAIPAAVMTNAFRSGYADGRAKPITGLKMLRDFMIRLVSLGVVAVLQVLAFRAGLQFDLLYLGLLAAGASFAGEMLAIAVYAVRRVRVDRTTTALVRLHDAGSTLPAE